MGKFGPRGLVPRGASQGPAFGMHQPPFPAPPTPPNQPSPTPLSSPSPEQPPQHGRAAPHRTPLHCQPPCCRLCQQLPPHPHTPGSLGRCSGGRLFSCEGWAGSLPASPLPHARSGGVPSPAAGVQQNGPRCAGACPSLSAPSAVTAGSGSLKPGSSLRRPRLRTQRVCSPAGPGSRCRHRHPRQGDGPLRSSSVPGAAPGEGGCLQQPPGPWHSRPAP